MANTARDVNCQLAIIKDQYYDPEDNRYKLRLGVKCPTEEDFQEFTKAIPEDFGIMDWQPLTAEAFIAGKEFFTFWSGMDSFMQHSWFESLVRAGFGNQRSQNDDRKPST